MKDLLFIKNLLHSEEQKRYPDIALIEELMEEKYDLEEQVYG